MDAKIARPRRYFLLIPSFTIRPLRLHLIRLAEPAPVHKAKSPAPEGEALRAELRARDQGQQRFIIVAVIIAVAIFVLPFLPGLIYFAIAFGNHLLKQLFH